MTQFEVLFLTMPIGLIVVFGTAGWLALRTIDRVAAREAAERKAAAE
jgi:hypothetical protein